MAERSVKEDVATVTGAAIDIGSNSVHVLVAEMRDGSLWPRLDESLILGLGARVDLDGRIGDADAALAIEALRGYVAAARDAGATWTLLLGTEPLRRAADRSAFCRSVEAAVGLPLHVLGHDEEALLTVLGVAAVVGSHVASEPTLVIDIGGGSSELVILEPGSDPVVGVLPVGSARLTAAHVEDDPPTIAEVEALRAEARRLVAGMPVGRPVRGIVTGGSGTNLLHLLRQVDGPEHAAGPAIDRTRARRAAEVVMARPSAELSLDVGLRPRRILQMAAGASLIEAALDCYGLDSLEAVDASLREGAILARQRAGETWRAELADLVAGSTTDPAGRDRP
jgi:exopolyphosphatase/guanosine-5'-triphosphate,3'-diphosphate pyrophosphatase